MRALGDLQSVGRSAPWTSPGSIEKRQRAAAAARGDLTIALTSELVKSPAYAGLLSFIHTGATRGTRRDVPFYDGTHVRI